MAAALPPLPIDEVLPQVVEALRTRTALVLRAATGAGKTSRVPPALLRAGAAGDRTVVMLEPRRLATRAAARRIAAEQGWRLGNEVGYQIRFDRQAGPQTRLLIVTEGILVQMLQSDPFLDGVGLVIFDEFHERNLYSDLSLAMVERVRREVRPDLRVVVMSATLDPQPLAELLGDAAVVESSGRLYPVDVRYLARPDPRPLPARVAAGVRQALVESGGDVLAFLPGAGEIHRTAELLAPLDREHGVRVLTLYGDLPGAEQDAVLAPGGRRKVVLATNVAETSVTVEGVTAVVDGGLAKVLRADPAYGLDRLELTRISRAAADQRAGRAGRQSPGLCLRLWTEHDDRSLVDRETPEIHRVDLAAAVLQLLAWGEREPAALPWLEPPAPDAVERALALLRELGAIDRGRALTAVGRAMVRLPLHPRLARLLIEGHHAGLAERGAWLAALLAERDVVRRPVGQRPVVAMTTAASDLLDRLEAVEAFARSGYGETALGPVDPGRTRQVLRVAGQLAELARRHLGKSPDRRGDEEALRRTLLAAYPDRVVRRREPGSRRGVMVGGRGVRLAEMSAVHDGELFLAVELDAGPGGGRGSGEPRGEPSEALVRQASRIEADWLTPERLSTRTEAYFDEGRERVFGRRRTYYDDLVISELEHDPGREEAERVLAAAAARQLDRALPLDDQEVAAFLARVHCLAEWMPELGLPTLGNEVISALLPSLVTGKRSFGELRRVPLLPVLQGALDYAQLRALDRHAPTHLTVPSGSRIRLRYEPGAPPVLAVRIQELFGLAETPTVAAGRVSVLLHLLAPNHRPQQVTQSLASFWRNTYPEVRKELKARYPRHAWPEDPLAAPPERRPRRRE